MPIISTILGIAAVAASGVGIAEQAKQQGTQQSALKDENAIAQQEMQDKQQVFNQAEAFYTPYTQSGSPYLSNIQSAAAGQNAQQTNNAAGLFRQQMGQASVGYGPSGATASGLAQIGSNAASTGASNYLANLLQNEQIKFQAQSGLTSAGQMAGASQNQPNVSAQLQPASTTGAIGAAGQALGGLSSGGTNVGQAINNVTPQTLGIPTPGTVPTTQIPATSVLTPPGVEGWNI